MRGRLGAENLLDSLPDHDHFAVLIARFGFEYESFPFAVLFNQRQRGGHGVTRDNRPHIF